jgi:hypothetical protein
MLCFLMDAAKRLPCAGSEPPKVAEASAVPSPVPVGKKCSPFRGGLWVSSKNLGLTPAQEISPGAPRGLHRCTLMQCASETFEIVRMHANDPSTRAIDVGDEKERNRDDERQNEK